MIILFFSRHTVAMHLFNVVQWAQLAADWLHMLWVESNLLASQERGQPNRKYSNVTEYSNIPTISTLIDKFL